MIPRPCVRCGDLIPAGSYCHRCQPRQHYQRGTKGRTATDRRWRNLSQRLRRESPFCANCGTTDDLTVDHITPISAGGDLYDRTNLAVLCRPCNSRKGAEPHHPKTP